MGNNMPILSDRKIRFEQGLLGFEQITEYILLQDPEAPAIMQFQAAGLEYPSFVVIDPLGFFDDYSPILSQEDHAYFEGKRLAELVFLTLVVVRSELKESIVNLKSPIVIDPEKMLAKQVILENLDYPIRFPLFQGHTKGGGNC